MTNEEMLAKFREAVETGYPAWSYGDYRQEWFEAALSLLDEARAERDKMFSLADLHSECHCPEGECDNCRLGGDNHLASLRRHCLRVENNRFGDPDSVICNRDEIRAVVGRVDLERERAEQAEADERYAKQELAKADKTADRLRAALKYAHERFKEIGLRHDNNGLVMRDIAKDGQDGARTALGGAHDA